jgi:hypothetical protein
VQCIVEPQRDGSGIDSTRRNFVEGSGFEMDIRVSPRLCDCFNEPSLAYRLRNKNKIGQGILPFSLNTSFCVLKILNNRVLWEQGQ